MLLALPAQAHRALAVAVGDGAVRHRRLDHGGRGDLQRPVLFRGITPCNSTTCRSRDPTGRRSRRRTSARAAIAAPSTSSWRSRHLQVTCAQPGRVRQLRRWTARTKRWRGKAEDLEKAIPANATDVKVSEIQGGSNPSSPAASRPPKPEADRHRVEMVPVTHRTIWSPARRRRSGWCWRPAGSGVAVEVVSGGIALSRQVNEQQGDDRRIRTFSNHLAGAGILLDERLGARRQKQDQERAAPRQYAATIEVLPSKRHPRASMTATAPGAWRSR